MPLLGLPIRHACSYTALSTGAEMALPALKLWTYAEYLEMEESSLEKHEFCDGVVLPLVVAMAGGRVTHAALGAQLSMVIGMGLRGGPCRPYSSDLRIRVPATSLSTYPDLSVICGPPRPAADDPHSATNPVLVVEVLSPSTEGYDRGEKFAHYRRLESLQDYVLVGSERRSVEVFSRQEDGSWSLRAAGEGEEVELRSLGLRLSVDEVYEGIALAPSSRRAGALGMEP